MSLYIELTNISELREVSDYRVTVFINAHKIAGPFKVVGHRRSDGWQKLVKTFAKQIKAEKYKSYV